MDLNCVANDDGMMRIRGFFLVSLRLYGIG